MTAVSTSFAALPAFVFLCVGSLTATAAGGRPRRRLVPVGGAEAAEALLFLGGMVGRKAGRRRNKRSRKERQRAGASDNSRRSGSVVKIKWCFGVPRTEQVPDG